MVVGFKDSLKLFGISIMIACASFVCTMFLNYRADLVASKDDMLLVQGGEKLYDALMSNSTMVCSLAGGCLIITSVIMLLSYVKNYVSSHGKELGIMKALGYSDIKIAKHFSVFGSSVFVGAVVGIILSLIYMPRFYEKQNSVFETKMQYHAVLYILLAVIPSLLFMGISVLFALMKLKKPVIDLLKEKQDYKLRKAKDSGKELPFLSELKKDTVRSRYSLIFLVGFSAFCFSAMTQMSFSMKDLASEDMGVIILLIGLVLAFTTILLSLSAVVKANNKTMAMMRVFGYSDGECSGAILKGYRPVSYIGFAIGTGYQYGILKIAVSVVFADLDNIPDYSFNVKMFFISLAAFIVTYETIMYIYSQKLNKLSIKSVMLET